MCFISIGFCYPGGVGGNYANNAPNMRNCTSCHSGSVNTGNGNVTILGLPSDGYNPGESYSLTVQVTGTNRNGYGFQIEMTHKAWINGYNIGEIPITFEDRQSGTSKMSGNIIYEALWVVWKLAIKNIFRKKPH